MAQQIIPSAQLASKFKGIRRCNNYVGLQSIPCSPECKIIEKILLYHPLSYALTTTVDVPAKKDIIQYPRFTKLIIADLMKKFSNIPQRIDEDYHSIKDDIPLIIEELFKQYVLNNVIQVDPTTTISTDTTSLTDLQKQLYLQMKRSLQDLANDMALWEVLKRKFVKSFTFNTSCRGDAFHSQHHDDHQDDDAPPEGEKIVKRQKTSKSLKFAKDETIIDEDEVILEEETPELITEFQNIDKRVLTIFDHAIMDDTLNDMLSNHFKNAEEFAYHLEQATNIMENQIVWENSKRT
uniref:Uncharacterized protein n=1 Tax=Tanacetum cinerariifolium TaxID=118510 RepID=A0A699GNK6_TANCI|nr:hypothetical protein [Tanacetum cinerariifolium]